MKKIIILLTTLLSLNLFGGLVHKDVDTRIQAGIGHIAILETYENGRVNIEGNLLMKSNIYKQDNFSVYAGGELELDNTFHPVKINGENVMKYIFTTNLKGVVGLEEEYKEVKFYQQLALGLGYLRQHGGTNGLNIIIPEVELGLNYKNVLFAVNYQINSQFNDIGILLYGGTYGRILFKLGYEF